MNGRIKLGDLRGEHIPRFGEKYVNRFNKILEIKENDSLKAGKGSIESSYGNVIIWRHQFVHKGDISATTNYLEVKTPTNWAKRSSTV